MKVYFIGAGPGAPDLITVRGARLLERCGICIYAGSLVNPEILGLLDPSAKVYDSSKMDLDGIREIFAQALESDIDVARLHTGDPSLYGATNEQMRILDELGVEYETVPGVSSFQACAARMNMELTTPELTQTVILTRISGRTKVPDSQSLEFLARTGSTLCVFLSVSRITEVVKAVKPYYGEDCPAFVAYKATWPDEVIVSSTLGDIAEKTLEANITKTAIIMIGPGLDRSGPASRLYDPTFSHHYRNGVK